MRLRLELVLAAVVAIAPLAGVAQPDAPVAAGETPTRAEVRNALDKVANDPNLAAERTVNMLRWKEPEPVTDEPGWWQWANAASALAPRVVQLDGRIGPPARVGAGRASRPCCWRSSSRGSCALAACRACRSSSLPRATSATSTFARRACPTTSAPRRSRYGSAASSVRRSRSCTAARCRASCTCTPCRFARRPRRASASRLLGRGSPSPARATRRASSRLGPPPSMAPASPRPAPSTLCAASSPRRSTARSAA